MKLRLGVKASPWAHCAPRCTVAPVAPCSMVAALRLQPPHHNHMGFNSILQVFFFPRQTQGTSTIVHRRHCLRLAAQFRGREPFTSRHPARTLRRVGVGCTGDQERSVRQLFALTLAREREGWRVKRSQPATARAAARLGGSAAREGAGGRERAAVSRTRQPLESTSANAANVAE